MPDYSFVSEYLFVRLSKCGGQFQQTFGSIFVQCACPVFDNIQEIRAYTEYLLLSAVYLLHIPEQNSIIATNMCKTLTDTVL